MRALNTNANANANANANTNTTSVQIHPRPTNGGSGGASVNPMKALNANAEVCVGGASGFAGGGVAPMGATMLRADEGGASAWKQGRNRKGTLLLGEVGDDDAKAWSDAVRVIV
jgi:hypothetical protein